MYVKSTKIWGQHQSQWILMKDAALDKDPQSIIFKVLGSTPKSVDFNERRRIGQGPSIDNFQSFGSTPKVVE